MPIVRRTARCLLLAAGLLGAAAASQAQTPPAPTPQIRRGVWAGAAVGYGHLSLTCRGCAPISGGANHLVLRAGATLGPMLLVGVEGDFWDAGGNDGRASLANIAGYLYPNPAGGAFLKAGLGYARFQGITSGDGGAEEHAAGFGLMAGAGVDLRIGKMYSIVPTVTVTREWLGDARFLGPTSSRPHLKSMVVALALGITFH